MEKNKHLTRDERNIIAERLKENESFQSIGNELKKDPTTIPKEVKKHITISIVGCSGKVFNNCRHRFQCNKGFICKECTYPKVIKRCRFCNRCSLFCDKVEKETKCNESYKRAYQINHLSMARN